MLRVDESALTAKTATLDLGPILTPASALAPGEEQVNTMGQDHFSPDATGLPYYPPEVTTSGYNLLDDSATIWLNDLATGVGHSRYNLPYVIAGSAGGVLRQGAYVDAGGVTNNKFFNTIINAVGCRKENGAPVDDFGDSSLDRGQVPEMLA